MVEFKDFGLRKKHEHGGRGKRERESSETLVEFGDFGRVSRLWLSSETFLEFRDFC